MNRRFAQVALAAAAAMTISLASPVTAQAAEPAPATRSGVDTSVPAPKATPSAASGSVRFTTSAVLNSYSTNTSARTRVSGFVPGVDRWSIYGDVFVNGRAAKRGEYLGSNSYLVGSVFWPRSAGYGTAQLRNVTIQYYDANYNKRVERLPDSNAVRIRRGLAGRDYVGVYPGTTKKFVAKRIRVVQPNGKTVAMRKLVIKRYAKGKWRKVKVMKLNKRGNGTTKVKMKKKHLYRVTLPTTATVQGQTWAWRGKKY